MQRVLPTVAAVLIVASLFFPWYYGTDDGVALTIRGWETDRAFRLLMLIAAAAMFAGARGDRRSVVAVGAVGAIALTIWMLPRGHLWSGYDLGPGGFIAIGAALLALLPTLRGLYDLTAADRTR